MAVCPGSPGGCLQLKIHLVEKMDGACQALHAGLIADRLNTLVLLFLHSGNIHPDGGGADALIYFLVPGDKLLLADVHTAPGIQHPVHGFVIPLGQISCILHEPFIRRSLLYTRLSLCKP